MVKHKASRGNLRSVHLMKTVGIQGHLSQDSNRCHSTSNGSPQRPGCLSAMAAPAESKNTAEKRKVSAKMLVTMFPRIPKTTAVLLEFFIKRESTVSLQRDPLSHFCQEEVVLHAQECLLKLNKQVINYQDIRDMIENLVGLHNICINKNPEPAKALGATIRKLIIIVAEMASSLERIAEVSVTDWVAIGDAIVNKLERIGCPEQPPFATFLPRIRDFKTTKMLGAGGFGAVYLATFKPANFVATVKLVAMDRFSRHKQAAMDKVVASVVRSPFMVKYYCCFCVKEAYVTIMEYVAGLDLMRVVTKEKFLEIGVVRIIMAQLILAIEHMHLRGFLHRDIKVSNMLILPGGRVKVIDFDTAKICSGHFSKRLLRGYFKRTAFEFNDGESAGTIPYMAPEILKRRPYAWWCSAGRAVDWWSSGIVMYKLMTGRVPFRGKTKQLLRDRIISAPLKWPRVEENPHSATAPAKDMAYRMLKKNPMDRLGSKTYNDLKTHPFFSRFNWQQLREKTDLCDIPSIKDLLNEDADRDAMTCPDGDDRRGHQKIEDMTDISNKSQKPLLCYASPSFKKLMLSVKQCKSKTSVNEEFVETSEATSTGIDYNMYAPGRRGTRTFVKFPPLSHRPSVTSVGSKDSRRAGPDKVDVIIFRKKKFCRYWGFGFKLRQVTGEDGNDFVYVEGVTRHSPADRSQLLPLDVITSVNGVPVTDTSVDKVKQLINKSLDQLVLTVMASSVYRLLTGRRDMMEIVRSMEQQTVVVPSGDFTCGGNNPYGLGLIEANTWDNKNKEYVELYLLTRAEAVPNDNQLLFPGDALTQVDGVEVHGQNIGGILQTIYLGGKDITLTVVPLSPFRVKRITVSKIQETAMTDANLGTKYMAADIATTTDRD